MTTKKKSKSAAPSRNVSQTKKPDGEARSLPSKPRKAGAKSKAAAAKTQEGKGRAVAAPAAKRAAKEESRARRKAGAKTESAQGEGGGCAGIRIGEPVLDPIGDVSSGEARTYLGDAELQAQAGAEQMRGPRRRIGAEAQAGREEAAGGWMETRRRWKTRPRARPPAKLERLQKILSQAGIASRRHAEEMIAAGRVMVNGQVVTHWAARPTLRATTSAWMASCCTAPSGTGTSC